MLEKTDIYINQVAQNVIALAEAVAWFEGLEAKAKVDVFDKLHFFVLNTKPNQELIQKAIVS